MQHNSFVSPLATIAFSVMVLTLGSYYLVASGPTENPLANPHMSSRMAAMDSYVRTGNTSFGINRAGYDSTARVQEIPRKRKSNENPITFVAAVVVTFGKLLGI